MRVRIAPKATELLTARAVYGFFPANVVGEALCFRLAATAEAARWTQPAEIGLQRFELTHELVAQMVGAPRSAVSESASALRERGIVG